MKWGEVGKNSIFRVDRGCKELRSSTPAKLEGLESGRPRNTEPCQTFSLFQDRY